VIDLDRLAGWMDGLGLAGKGEPIEHRFVSGGTNWALMNISLRMQNLTRAISLVAGNRKERAAHPGFARRS
jgi:hypothetical protein